MTIDLDTIRAARMAIGDRVHQTPLFGSTTLGGRIGARLHLKCESFQKTGSFKARGALNTVLSLDDHQRRAGLITVSAGNHAAATAWAAREVGAPCAVVMPTDAPRSKIAAVHTYGGEVILHDDRNTLFDRLDAERKARGATFVHPFDDERILAGAGTVALEILDRLPEPDLVVVPVGGGGLMGGTATALAAASPRTRVVAVELAEGPALQPALDAGEPVPVRRPETLADGLTAPFVGRLPLAVARDHIDAVVGVTELQIREAMRLLFTRCKLFVEASGAAALAALLAGAVSVEPDSNVVAIVSGGNVDIDVVAALFADSD